MIVLCINHPCEWVQIIDGGRRYTCPTKEINGDLYFHFKNEWHKVDDYTNEYTDEFS